MSEISTAEMREYLSTWVNRLDAEMVSAIRAALLERDALKAEVEELNSDIEIQKKFVTKADEWFDEMRVWKARAEKAEATLAAELKRSASYAEEFRKAEAEVAELKDALKDEHDTVVELWKQVKQAEATLAAKEGK